MSDPEKQKLIEQKVSAATRTLMRELDAGEYNDVEISLVHGTSIGGCTEGVLEFRDKYFPGRAKGKLSELLDFVKNNEIEVADVSQDKIKLFLVRACAQAVRKAVEREVYG